MIGELIFLIFLLDIIVIISDGASRKAVGSAEHAALAALAIYHCQPLY